MSVKGRRAKRTLDAHCTVPRFHQRQAVVSGWGMNPCPEPETRAVLTLDLSKRSAQRPGIVTRQGGDSNEVNDSVSKANRARKGPHIQLQLLVDEPVIPAVAVVQVLLPEADHNQGIDASSFYRIYHEHRFSMTPETRWANFRWALESHRDFEVSSIAHPKYQEYLRNQGGWLAMRIQDLGGMAGAW